MNSQCGFFLVMDCRVFIWTESAVLCTIKGEKEKGRIWLIYAHLHRNVYFLSNLIACASNN